jgi:hypothetical protein
MLATTKRIASLDQTNNEIGKILSFITHLLHGTVLVRRFLLRMLRNAIDADFMNTNVTGTLAIDLSGDCLKACDTVIVS